MVSDRAIKHIHELTKIHETGVAPPLPSAAVSSPAKGKGKKRAAAADAPDAAAAGSAAQGEGRLSCALLFVVGRSDCAAFRPCDEADPIFANMLKKAQDAGACSARCGPRLCPPCGLALSRCFGEVRDAHAQACRSWRTT